MSLRVGIGCLIVLAAAFAPPLSAEPYFAVREGLSCGTCHVNPTGGGMRTEFGNVWAARQLAAMTVDSDPWTGRVNDYVAVGGNLRANLNHVDIPNQSDQFEFLLHEVRLFLDVEPVPGRVGVYVDQRVAPGGSLNREAYARYRSESGEWVFKAGQMYLPYGLRLEDDSAFIRLVPGINMTTPDRGVEVGFERDAWNLQAAFSNGTAGGPEVDRGKQFSLRTEYLQARWRAGASVNVNDTATGTRHMQNVFAGIRTGDVVWLAEIDRISDGSTAPSRTQWVALLEANWMPRRGHNLKLTAEYLDPNRRIGGINQSRLSAVWEYTPYQFIQVRAGIRHYDGSSEIDIQNRRIAFAQLHGYF